MIENILALFRFHFVLKTVGQKVIETDFIKWFGFFELYIWCRNNEFIDELFTWVPFNHLAEFHDNWLA